MAASTEGVVPLIFSLAPSYHYGKEPPVMVYAIEIVNKLTVFLLGLGCLFEAGAFALAKACKFIDSLRGLRGKFHRKKSRKNKKRKNQKSRREDD